MSREKIMEGIKNTLNKVGETEGADYEIENVNENWALATVPAGLWRRMDWQQKQVDLAQSDRPEDREAAWATVRVGRNDEARPHIIPQTELAQQYIESAGNEHTAWFGLNQINAGEIFDPSTQQWRIAARFGPQSAREPLLRAIETLNRGLEDFRSHREKYS